MINEVIIRNPQREIIGIVDAFNSVIWNPVYYGVGSFEIYAPFDSNNAALLKKDNYVSRYGRRDVGIIESVEIAYTAGGALMITATGRFAKSILDRRLIYSLTDNVITPVIFRGNVETAARTLVNNHIIAATDSARNIDFIGLGVLAGLPARIVDAEGNAADRQTSYGGLLDITDKLLEQYHYGAFMAFDETTKKFLYTVYAGADKTTGSENPLIFSQEFDNLISSDYIVNGVLEKNAALCGGAGEGTARKYVLITDSSKTGINRRELFVDGSSNSETYTDEHGETQEYTTAEYLGMLNTTAKQTLTEYQTTEQYNGEIDVTSAGLEFEVDYNVGDVITIRDNVLNLNKNTRIISVTEVEDAGGYSVQIEYKED